MKGKWTICPGPQPDTIFQSQNLLYFLCKMSEKQNALSPKSEKGARRLSGWDSIICKLKKKLNALFFPFPPHPFPSGEEKNPTVGKGKGDSTILFRFLCIAFVGGGAWGSPSSPDSKKGLNPTSGCCGERLPRKFGVAQRGWLLPGGGTTAGKMGGGTQGAPEARSKSPF